MGRPRAIRCTTHRAAGNASSGGVHFEKEEVSTPCPTTTSLPQTPFLTLPTACAANPAAEPVASSVEAESWAEPGYVQAPPYVWSGPLGEPLGFTGCSELAFEPSIGVVSRTARRRRAGERDRVRPRPHRRPAGSARACRGRRARHDGDAPGRCRAQPVGGERAAGLLGAAGRFRRLRFFRRAAVLGRRRRPARRRPSSGSVHITTPLLPHELEGALYLAEPAPNGEAGQNPFNSLIALYLVAEDGCGGARQARRRAAT